MVYVLSPPTFQDLIIFPEDCEFKRVSQVTSGRVYVLRFKAGSKRLFFWMQVSWGGFEEELLRCSRLVDIYTVLFRQSSGNLCSDL